MNYQDDQTDEIMVHTIPTQYRNPMILRNNNMLLLITQ